MSALRPLLADLKEQRTYRFLEPWRISSRALGLAVPIVRTDYGPRAYLVLDEIPGGVDIRDSGSIRRLIARSGVNKPVFVRGGLILKGETQPRAVRFSVVILPGEERPIEALCVHEVRPIRAKAKFRLAIDVPAEFYEPLVRGDQIEVWSRIREVAEELTRMEEAACVAYARATAPELHIAQMLDLTRISEELEVARKNIRDVVELFRPVKDQVGVAIIDARGVYALEVFDHPDSWSAVAKNAGRRFADILAQEADYEIFTPNKEGIMKALMAFLDKLEACSEEEVFKNEVARTSVLEGEDICGEYTVLEGSVIHLLAVRTEGRPRRLSEEFAFFRPEP